MIKLHAVNKSMTLLMAAAFALAGRGTIAQDIPINMVSNHGFEEGAKPWNLTSGESKIDSSTAHGGKNSLMLDMRPDKKTAAYQSIKINQADRAPITVGFWSKAEKVDTGKEGECRVRIFAHAGDKTFANSDSTRAWNIMNFDIKKDGGWAYQERTFEFDKPIKALDIGIQGFNSSGKAWFDDFFARTFQAARPPAIASPASSNQACSLEKTAAALLLENQFVKVEIDYQRGGRISSFIDKQTGKDFTDKSNYGGIFKDVIMEHGFGAFFGQFYLIDATNVAPGKVSVTITGETGKDQFLKIQKTYTLERDSSVLKADFKVINAYEAMAARFFTLRHHNVMKFPGEKNAYFFPSSNGVRQVTEGSVADVFHRDVVDGWAAFIAPSSRSGLLCALDYAPLDSFYNWFGQETTLEWFFKTVKIENGKSWDTSIALMPLHGLDAISGAAAGLAVDFAGLKEKYEKNEKPSFELAIASGIAGKAEVEIKVKQLPEGSATLLKKINVELKPGMTQKLPVSWNAPLAAPCLLTCAIMDEQGNALMEAARPVAAGEEKAGYVFKPAKAKLPTVEGGAIKQVRFTGDFVTPHVRWARPYAGGSIRVLGILNAFTARELLELAERLDMEHEAVILPSPHGAMPGHSPNYTEKDANNLMAELLKKDYDVILLGGVNGKCISAENTKTIGRKVKEGTGLVHVFPTCLTNELAELIPLKPPVKSKSASAAGTWEVARPHEINAGIPFDALPPVGTFMYECSSPILTAGGLPLAAAAQLEKSRVVAFGYAVAFQEIIDKDHMRNFKGGLTPTNPGGRGAETGLLYPYWEYYYALLCKAVIWAANKSPATHIGNIKINGNKCMVEIKPAVRNKLTMEWELKDNSWASITNGIIGLEANQSDAEIILPPHHGTALLHLRLLDKGKVVDFAAKKLSFPDPVKVNGIEAALSSGPDGTADLAAKISVSGPGRLEIGLYDAHNRLVARTNIVAGAEGAIPLGLKFSHPVARACRLVVKPFDNAGVPGDSQAKYVYLSAGRKDFADYRISMWLMDTRYIFMPEYLDDIYYGRIAGCGAVDAVQIRNAGGELTSNANYYGRVVPFLWRHNLEVAVNNVAPQHLDRAIFDKAKKNYQETRSREWLARTPCLHDPEYQAKSMEKLRAMVNDTKCYEPFLYCFGDENSLTRYGTPIDFCFSEHSLKAFRAWAGEKYGTIKSLNAAYKTAYKSFDEVIPLTTEEAKAQNNFASWLDHRVFMDEAFAGFYRRAREEVRRLDPGAPVQISGTQNQTAYNGCDWRRLTQVFDSMAPYGGIQTELMRSFAPQNYRGLRYLGGYGSSTVPANELWLEAFRYRGAGMQIYIDEVMLNCDYTADPIENIARETAELRQGIGKILINSKPIYRVGLLFSPPSQKIASITDQEALYDSNIAGWTELLNESGLLWRFVAPDELGSPALAEFKTIILPFSVCLSGKDLEALEKFTGRGGTIIADAGAGLYDGFGRRADPDKAAELFGISRPSGAILPGDLQFNDLSFRVKLHNENVMAGNAAPAGAAAGKPAVFRKSCGKGQAVFLNFTIEDYPRVRGVVEENNKFLALLDNLMPAGNTARGPARITRPDGSPAQACRPFVFELGGIKYLGLVRDLKCPKGFDRIKVNLDGKYHAYDVRKHVNYGHADVFELELPAGEAAFIALSAGQVEALELSAPRKAAPLGSRVDYVITVKAASGKIPARFIRVTSHDPSGNPVSYYSANLLATEGKAEGFFQSALNDTPGKWKISAVDLATGITGEQIINLAP
jgi:hypothetical protein